MLEQVEEHRLGPLQVVEHDDERPLARERRQEAPDSPEEVVR